MKMENVLHLQHVLKRYYNCNIVVFNYTWSAFKVIKLITECTLSGYGSLGIITIINLPSPHKSHKKPNSKPKPKPTLNQDSIQSAGRERQTERERQRVIKREMQQVLTVVMCLHTGLDL